MRRMKRWLGTLLLGLGLLLGGLALTGTAGCEVSEDEFYKKDTQWNEGLKKNPNKKYAFAYVALAFFGAFMLWAVCKSSKRSVVKGGREH